MNYYEIELENSKLNKTKSICIKAIKTPTKTNLKSFIEKNIELIDFDKINKIVLISKEDAIKSFNMIDKPIFGLKTRSDFIKNISKLDKSHLMEFGGTRVELDDLSSKIIPIKTNSQLQSSIIYSKAKSKGFKQSLSWQNKKVVSTILKDKKHEQLRKLLLSFGGNETNIVVPEEDIDNILKYGQFWFGKNALMMKGIPSQCHKNSCDLWESQNNRNHCRICTGYALDTTGIWRQHSWIINFKSNSNQIIETTMK